MKLYLKRDVSDSATAFLIYDELGKENYRAAFNSIKQNRMSNLTVFDASGKALAKIRRLPIVGTNTYVLRAYKKHITFVTVSTSKGIYSYFYGNNWHINGEIASKNFSIIDVDNTVVMTHNRKTDYCEMQIFDESKLLLCIAASVCANLINTVNKLSVQTA